MNRFCDRSGAVALRGLLLMAALFTLPVLLWAEAQKKEKEPAAKQEMGETEITADRMEYNYAESVAVMSDNVKVENPQFLLTADKLFIFFEGTNALNQIVVKGHVNVSNENRRVTCDTAVYSKADDRLVMEGNARLKTIQDDGKEMTVDGERITIWVAERRVEITDRPKIILPAGMVNADALDGGSKGDKGEANDRK